MNRSKIIAALAIQLAVGCAAQSEPTDDDPVAGHAEALTFCGPRVDFGAVCTNFNTLPEDDIDICGTSGWLEQLQIELLYAGDTSVTVRAKNNLDPQVYPFCVTASLSAVLYCKPVPHDSTDVSFSYTHIHAPDEHADTLPGEYTEPITLSCPADAPYAHYTDATFYIKGLSPL